MGTRPDLIILAGGMWEERWTTYQRIASCFRQDFRMLYVEGNYSWGKIARAVAYPGSFPITPLGRLRTVDQNFHILTPSPRIFLRHYLRSVGLLNQTLLRTQVRDAARRLGMKRPILWTFLHQSDRLMGSFNERLAVYHCVDSWPWLIPTVPMMGSANRIASDEALTAAKANFTISTSRALQRKLLAHNRHSYYVPNAVDFDHFSAAATANVPVPEDMATIPRPILGFSGTLEVKSDLDLLRHIATARPDWSQVYVGHADNVPDIATLRKLPNVHFLGMKPLDTLPSYLRHFDVCLIPFRRTPALETVSPLKVFEYLAVGRPVVAMRYGEIEEFGNVVSLCNDYDEFILACDKALRSDDPTSRGSRLAVARENTWERRYESLRLHVNSALQDIRTT